MSSRFSTGLRLVVLLLVSHIATAGVWAHAYPAVASPLDGATLQEPPREVRIQFTEALELAFSQIIVKASNGELVSQGKLRKLADDTVAIDLKPLGPGNYTVEWQVLSIDTHVTEGVLRFAVGAGGK
jgi:methionine-rich copper-binding protein CopC